MGVTPTDPTFELGCYRSRVGLLLQYSASLEAVSPSVSSLPLHRWYSLTPGHTFEERGYMSVILDWLMTYKYGAASSRHCARDNRSGSAAFDRA